MAIFLIDLRRLALLVLPLAVVACTPAPRPAAAPPAPPPAPPVVPVHSGDWRDWPLTPGGWRYQPGTAVSIARYGDAAVSQFVVRCDAATRRITLMRSGSTTELVIATSTRSARFPAGQVDDSGVAMSGVILNAADNFLDQMVFSRGRIAVTSPGLPGLALPTWAEPARAIEDCRK